MRVLWTDTAISQLEQIFYYYSHKANARVAEKLVNEIVTKSLLLEAFPESGQKEESLLGRKKQYRYLVQGNYKIIYWIDEDLVKVANIFDCRQSPERIQQIE
jgi:plasmid stabilization system protein ParE